MKKLIAIFLIFIAGLEVNRVAFSQGDSLALVNELKSVEAQFSAAEKKRLPVNSRELERLTRASIPLLQKAVAFEQKSPDDLLLETALRVAVYINEVEPTGYAASILFPLLQTEKKRLYRALAHQDDGRTKKLRNDLRIKLAEAAHGNG